MTACILTFLRDFSSHAGSRYFITDESGFREVDAIDIVACKGIIICHDFWMICQSIYAETGGMPNRIVDLDELHILASKDPEARIRREKYDVVDRMAAFLHQGEDTLRFYKKMMYREVDVDPAVHAEFHQLLLVYYIELCRLAKIHGEMNRFFEIEVPCAGICAKIAGAGIPISGATISKNRATAKHDYYNSLREASDRFNIPLETPSENDIKRYASTLNVDFESYSSDFIFNYLPQMRPYSEAVQKVRDLAQARDVLDSIAVKSDRVFPTLDVMGSRTARISVRSPFLQSLAKKYRDIIRPAHGQNLSYVDFDQFEVGIMAALSGDEQLLGLYDSEDMYEQFRVQRLASQGNRKSAKILFLAYAYGMKRQNLPIVGLKFGIERKVVKSAFRSFSTFEKWKNDRLTDFRERGYVSTSLGNRFYSRSKVPSKKEELSAISQIVQGEGSLIFKKALIQVSRIPDVELLLPMHDAILFQHKLDKTPFDVVGIFVETMTRHFSGKVLGKASIESFFEE